jgi:hypothetical protein
MKTKESFKFKLEATVKKQLELKDPAAKQSRDEDYWVSYTPGLYYDIANNHFQVTPVL